MGAAIRIAIALVETTDRRRMEDTPFVLQQLPLKGTGDGIISIPKASGEAFDRQCRGQIKSSGLSQVESSS
jgi:hypothetical protein